MYAAFFIYSLASVFSKLASRNDFLSLPYLLCLFVIVVILGIYAILWQQVLKNIPLSIAMANKPIALVLSLVWAFFLFKEHLSIKIMAGIVLVLIGVAVIGLGAKK